MKKICIIIPYQYPVPAVCGGAVETLVQFLIEENEKDPSFIFTVLGTYDRRLEDTDVSYRYTKFVYYEKCKYIDGVWWFVFRAIKKILHVYIPFAPRFVSILGHLKREGSQYDHVLFENGLTYMLPLVEKVYPRERILNHLHWPGDGNRRIDKSFGYLLPVSDFCAEEWKHATGRQDDKIYVWRNCYDDSALKKTMEDAEKEQLCKSLDIQEKDKVLIYIGRMIPEKGVKELLIALQKITQEDLVLLLIGSSNFGLDKKTGFEREIQRIIDRSKVKIIPLGFIPNDELYRYYSISTLAVMPTLIAESAGMVNIEAMASGVPLITTDIGAVKEYVGDAAVVIDIEEENFIERLAGAIDELLDDPEKRKELIQSGIKKAEEYTRKKYFADLITFFNVLDGNG